MHVLLKFRILFFTIVSLASLAAPAHAAVVGYWRFEGDDTTRDDDSNGSRHLTSNNGTIAGVATPFDSTIPKTNLSNLMAASLPIANSRYYTRADSTAFNNQSFTVEAYIQATSFGAGNLVRTIAAQYNANGANQAAWLWGITGAGSGLGAGEVLFQLSHDGATITNFDSNLALTSGSNYYLAATVTTGVSGASVTFYLKNLTAGTALQTTSPVTSSVVTGVFNSTSNFSIGASYTNGAASRYFDGLIDEVRWSNTVLSSSELLITPIPEPASCALGAGGLILAFAALRRRPRGRG